MLRGIKLDSNKEISITSEIVDASFPNKVYILSSFIFHFTYSGRMKLETMFKISLDFLLQSV